MQMVVDERRVSGPGNRFMVGRDAQGNWVVCDRLGLVGGIFADKDAAVHFAMIESGRVPGAVRCVPDDVEVPLASIFAPARRAPFAPRSADRSRGRKSL